jgi:protein gp37
VSDGTKIEWTEATWNPVTGCTKVSAGCKHCYAERDWARLSANKATRYFGRDFTDVQCHEDVLDLPQRWTRPRRIFVNSMSDLFHPSVPFGFIADVFGEMAIADWHTFQVLTKRPERMLEFFASHENHPAPSNVWLGVSVEDQAAADERIPLLLKTKAAVRWISAEPLLGRVDLCETFGMWWNQTMDCFESTSAAGFNRNPNNLRETAIDWVVVGGESGPKARPMRAEWARSLRDQCAAAGVAYLFKQWGEWAPYNRGRQDGAVLETENSLDMPMQRVGKKLAGRMLDGVQHDGYPKGGA